jgi:hypothetical protein
VIVALAAPAAADAKPRLSWVKCMDACMGSDLDDGGKVRRGGRLKLGGGGFTEGARVVFQVKRDGKRVKRTVRADRSGSKRLSVDVPLNALSSRIYVRVRGGKRTNSEGPVRMAAPQKDNAPSSPSGTPFDGAGMWVWELPNTEGGNSGAIASRALGNNVSTVFIKSGDGTNYWDQFSPGLVADLKARGLRVCAWQYIYGRDPAGEAAVAARSVKECSAGIHSRMAPNPGFAKIQACSLALLKPGRPNLGAALPR